MRARRGACEATRRWVRAHACVGVDVRGRAQPDRAHARVLADRGGYGDLRGVRQFGAGADSAPAHCRAKNTDRYVQELV